MNKTFAITLFAASCLMGGLAQAQSTSVLLVEFQGPGGHSSGNYGRTSALHAAARAVIGLQKSMPKDALAAKSGADAKNAFRNVKPGDLTAGAPADIRYSVKQQ